MKFGEMLLLTGHVAAAVVVLLAVGHAGRVVARLLRQPPVVGEITFGLLAGPLVIAIGGRAGFDRILPADVLTGLRDIGHIGLALFLVGVAHHLQVGPARMSGRAVTWTTLGGFVPPLVLGGVFAALLLTSDDAGLRGTSSTPAFVVMVMVSLCVTAVPVLARMLQDHSMTDTIPGRLSMASAAVIDGVAWLMLGVAVGLASGGVTDVAVSLVILVAGVVLALGIRRLLKAAPVTALAGRSPWVTAVLIGAGALATTSAMTAWGLTGVVGAFLIGLAVPGGQGSANWTSAVDRLSKAGRLILPLFFVVAGVDVFTQPMTGLPWMVFLIATVLAIVGKVGGGYLGARLGGQSRPVATRVGILLNTRGLTEIVVLQAGYAAGLLPGPLFLALLAMALVTTAMTGPLLRLADRFTRPAPEPVVPVETAVRA
jgi:Kef-type K+ transport system membrane component KefB